MSLENESVDSTESVQEDSGSEVAQTESNNPGLKAEDSAGNENTVTDNRPFHEHPRFQELVNEKNQYQLKLSELEKSYQKSMYESEMKMREFEQRLPQKEAPRDGVYEKLKEIDPEFADYVKGMKDEISRLKSYEDKFSQYDQRFMSQDDVRLRENANNEMNNLYTKYAVPDTQKDLVKTVLKALAYEDPKADIPDMPRLFKQAYDMVSGITRADRKSYVVDKRNDVVPASQTGGAAVKQGNKPMSRQDIVNSLAKEIRANKQSV